MKNALTSKATEADIERVVKSWLRYAKDRDGGRIKRLKRKMMATPQPEKEVETTHL